MIFYHLLTLTIDERNLSFLLSYVTILRKLKKPLINITDYSINLHFY